MPDFSKLSPIHHPAFASLILAAIALATPSAAANDDAIPWAFSKIERPAIPETARPKPVCNPIDAFILAKLQKVGLSQAERADKLLLLQRAFHDVVGLAPTAAERERFLSDASPDAYEKLIDRLLASHHYGERWAQHWLDVVRYSESEGFKVDRYRPNAWRYRDYVIRAFNSDLPYDRFVRQQIAGDELEPANPEAHIATGFLRLHPEESNGADYRQIRQDILDDVTDAVGMTFMGVTVGCARCHDHKADPISQKDYFALQAFFAGMLPRDDLPLLADEGRVEWNKRQQTWETATKTIRDRIEAMVAPHAKAMADEVTVALDPETQAALKTPHAKQSPVQRQLACYGSKQVRQRMTKAFRRLNAEEWKEYEQLKAKLAAFDHLKPEPLPTAMATTDVGDHAPDVHRLAGGNLARKREAVAPAFPEVFGDAKADVGPDSSHPGTTGRRAALARWLTRPDHPLVARVVVNRIWQHYFGEGIVASPNDFGAMGSKATHPELLDWLASELLRNDWSLKSIHRLILTSATYRQSSRPDRNPSSHLAQRNDPENHLLWHARVRRVDGETLRDLALQVSGNLEDRPFGPSASPALPKAVYQQSRYAWNADEKPEDRNRRSIYLFHRRNLIFPLFQAFDAPNRLAPCGARQLTITAPQSLTMLNDEFFVDQARRTAGRLLLQTRNSHRLAELAYLRVLGRGPSPRDWSAAERFLEQQARSIAQHDKPTLDTLPDPLPANLDSASAAAVVDLVHALMNSAEFLYVE
ncbi:MAG: DUF1549 and DUF1553 domain-containing protein [Gemmataceae bacterium]|nr:DUF1549 and DUF1553 domain-containing protein [Gemmataceae bacterium]